MHAAEAWAIAEVAADAVAGYWHVETAEVDIEAVGLLCIRIAVRTGGVPRVVECIAVGLRCYLGGAEYLLK